MYDFDGDKYKGMEIFKYYFSKEQNKNDEIKELNHSNYDLLGCDTFLVIYFTNGNYLKLEYNFDNHHEIEKDMVDIRGKILSGIIYEEVEYEHSAEDCIRGDHELIFKFDDGSYIYFELEYLYPDCGCCNSGDIDYEDGYIKEIEDDTQFYLEMKKIKETHGTPSRKSKM